MTAIDDALAAGFPADLLLPIAPPGGARGGTIRPENMGKAPARIEADHWQALSSWQQGVEADWLMHCAKAGANAGLLLGVGENPVLAIDVDLDAGHEPERRSAVDAATEHLLDEFIADAVVRSTVPYRALLLVRLPTGADPGRKVQWKLSDAGGNPIGKIELLAHGQQAVIGGTHASGNPIRWNVFSFANIPELPSRPEVLHLVDVILRALRVGHAVNVVSRSIAADSTFGARMVEDLAPPSAADVVSLLDRLPNPITTDRQTWTAVMLAAKGCIDGLAAQGNLTNADEEAIRNAACRWAARWPDADGIEAEIQKWEGDWSTRDAPLAGWGSLERFAADRIPGYRHEQAATEFAALPEPTVNLLDLPEPSEPNDDWQSMLLRGKPAKDGTPGPVKANLKNAIIAFRHAPEWADRVAFDIFADRLLLLAEPPWSQPGEFAARSVGDVDFIYATEWMQGAGIAISGDITRDAMLAVGMERKFHPVRDYLSGLPAPRTARLNTWLVDYLGAEDTPYNRAVGRAFLVSAVARVMRPGCKVDTVLILEGRQGLRKSSALATLANGWFIDHMPDLTNKDAAMQMQGVWIVEFAELDKLSRIDANVAKRFVSTATDRFRRPYGRVTEDFPRQCVFAGTVNPGGVGYLRDETGNRRYWPVTCGIGWDDDQEADIAGLRAARDDLWSEALAAFNAGEAWWLSTSEEHAQKQVSALRVAEDTWSERIRGYLGLRAEVSIPDVLADCIRKPMERWTEGDQARVGRVLVSQGWTRKHVLVEGGARDWRYFPPASHVVVPLLVAASSGADDFADMVG